MIVVSENEKYSKGDLDDVQNVLKEYRSQMGKCNCYEKMSKEIEEIESGDFCGKKGGCVLIYRDTTEKLAGIVLGRKFSNETMEMKRMYVVKEFRRNGIACKLVEGLEKVAKKMGYERVVLNVGKKNAFAVKLYKKNFYREMDEPYYSGCNIPGGSYFLEHSLDGYQI